VASAAVEEGDVAGGPSFFNGLNRDKNEDLAPGEGDGMILSADSAAVVTATAGVVAEHAEQITAVFYQRMFAAHPQLLSLFNQGNQANGEQRRALAGSVVAYAVHLIDPRAPDFGPVLARIAHKHVSLGVRPEQYPIVGRHLMAAVGEVLGDAVTPEVAAAWDEVYWLFAVQLVAEEARLYRQVHADPEHLWRPWRVVGRRQETADTVSLVLTPRDGPPADEPLPGQYVSVLVDLPDGTRQPRQYSVSSVPDPGSVQLTVRRVRGQGGSPDGRVSAFLHDAVAVGDVLELGPAVGDVLLEPGAAPLLLASAGIGVTPVAGMVEHLARTAPDRRVVLAHADRGPLFHALRESVAASAALLSKVSRHTWYETGEREPGPAETVHPGRMDLRDVDLPDGVEAFLCGPLPFLRDVRAQLLRRGVAADRIRYEVFGPDLWAGSPPDGDVGE
jgi:ferredoxin-NADP reductase/hemoglobin-like flavoprotein